MMLFPVVPFAPHFPLRNDIENHLYNYCALIAIAISAEAETSGPTLGLFHLKEHRGADRKKILTSPLIFIFFVDPP